MTKPVVFIHTNAKQMVGAIASAHSFKRNSATPDAFDVRLVTREDHDFFDDFEGPHVPALRDPASLEE